LSPKNSSSNADYDESIGTNLLGRLGLTKNQASLYAVLVQGGPATISELAKRCGIHRANAYRIVSHLKKMGLIELLLGAVTRARALAVGEALDILIARQEEQLDMIRSAKSQTRWPSQLPVEYGMSLDRSQIFARLVIGRHVYAQEERLIQESTDEIIQVTSMKGYLLARNMGLIDLMAAKARTDGVKVRILAEITGCPASIRSEIPKEIEVHHCPGTLSMLRYFIADKNHLILKMAPPPRTLDQSVALWSNSSDLIHGLRHEFEVSWARSRGGSVTGQRM